MTAVLAMLAADESGCWDPLPGRDESPMPDLPVFVLCMLSRLSIEEEGPPQSLVTPVSCCCCCGGGGCGAATWNSGCRARTSAVLGTLLKWPWSSR